MIQENPHLEEFLRNSREVRDELAAIPDIVGKIETKLATEEGWNRGTFIELIPGQYGLKKRYLEDTIVEVTTIADLYTPDLEISPFVVLYEGGLAYVVKDHGEMDRATEQAVNYDPIRNAIRHMIRRGYGTYEGDDPNSSEAVEELADLRIPLIGNYWQGIFQFDGKDRWAMIDFDLENVLINQKTIYDGANQGIGKFARLNGIWQKLNTPDYTIS